MESEDRRPVLIVATLSAFLIPFTGAALNVALPQMGSELSADGVALGWFVTSFLLAAAMFLVPLGKLADIRGRKQVFMVGAWIFAATSLLLALASSTPVVIMLRALQGFGGAMIFGNGVALLTSVYPANERGRVIGVNIAAVYCGLSMGPFIGGFLTQQLGWRSIFVVTALLSVATALISTWKLKGEWVAANKESFDSTGSLLYCATMFALMYGLSELPAPHGLGYLVAGALGLVAFIYWEAGARHPILELRLFRDNLAFAYSNLAALLIYGATAAVGFLLSLHLHYVKGLSPQDTGFVLLAQPVVMAAFSPLAGKLSDRIEPRTLASAGMAITCLGLLILASIDTESSLWFIVATLMLLGFGFALFSSPNTNAIMSSVEKRFYGVASGTMGTMRLLGQMLSMCISMLIIANVIGRVQITPEHGTLLVQSARVTYLIFAALCFGGILASQARGNIHQAT